MKVLLPAENADRAVLYAENRWPGAIVSDAERVRWWPFRLSLRLSHVAALSFSCRL